MNEKNQVNDNESIKSDSISENLSEICNHDETSTESESEEENKYGIAINLPKRTTKANRYSKVMNEAEDEFWQHETWKEENNDDEYVCSEGEELYKDVYDSDFDEQEEEDNITDDQNTEVEIKSKKKKNVYIDPSKLGKRKTKQKIVKNRSKSHISGNNLLSSNLEQSIVNNLHIKTRKTTREQSEQIEIIRLEREVEKQKKASKRSRIKTILQNLYHEPTQEEHLKKAKLTEEANKRSLIALQEWEEERKRYVEYKKQKYLGHYTVWISWASDRLIMSDEIAKRAELEKSFDAKDPKYNPPAKYYKTKNLKYAPELLIFTDGKLSNDYINPISNSIHPRCIVTGNKAKYLDPLTKCYYDSMNSFKILRQWYHDAQDINILSDLKEMEIFFQSKLQKSIKDNI